MFASRSKPLSSTVGTQNKLDLEKRRAVWSFLSDSVVLTLHRAVTVPGRQFRTVVAWLHLVAAEMHLMFFLQDRVKAGQANLRSTQTFHHLRCHPAVNLQQKQVPRELVEGRR